MLEGFALTSCEGFFFSACGPAHECEPIACKSLLHAPMPNPQVLFGSCCFFVLMIELAACILLKRKKNYLAELYTVMRASGYSKSPGEGVVSTLGSSGRISGDSTKPRIRRMRVDATSMFVFASFLTISGQLQLLYSGRRHHRNHQQRYHFQAYLRA